MSFEFPEITDNAISSACRTLGMSYAAFAGIDGQDPRLEVLKSLETMDVEACPGSGKTTLLVAKLAILADLWNDTRHGLCVLSHTNVARREIEHRLGGTSAGQRLLSHPHFVGTIHSFVNEFLALPWLRSLGVAVEVIDNEIAQLQRWNKLPPKIRAGLEKNRHDHTVLRIHDPTYSVGSVSWGRSRLGPDTQTYKALVNACYESINEGYLCHDEMFVWACDLLDQVPETAGMLRKRFPLFFLDEAQDNSEQQSDILHRIFVEGGDAVVRQRYGDANQAIYQYVGQKAGATTDPFPRDEYADIPNSFRFGQEIADLAAPLAIVPQTLQGRRPAKDDSASSDTTEKHTVFLFDDNSIDYVLDNYSAYLMEVFSADERANGIFTAIGAVHRPTGDDRVPRHVGHYWPDYDPAINRSDPQPETLMQYVNAGRRLANHAGHSQPFVEKLADGLIALARRTDGKFSAGARKRRHRYIVDLLNDNPDAKAHYWRMVTTLAVDQHIPTKEEWGAEWRPMAKAIAEAMTGCLSDERAVGPFLEWLEPAPEAEVEQQPGAPQDNVFHYPHGDPGVTVRVGSIHAAKGETHTATLVLETFYHAHHLKKLKPWLLGDRRGGAGESAALQSRIKLHYVAMTRPSRLLCVALRADSLNDKDIKNLRDRGWRIAHAGAGGPNWTDDTEEHNC